MSTVETPTDEKLQGAKELNSIGEFHEWLSSRRLVNDFLEWCLSDHNVNFSRMLLVRTKVTEQENKGFTNRQNLLLKLSKEFYRNSFS